MLNKTLAPKSHKPALLATLRAPPPLTCAIAPAVVPSLPPPPLGEAEDTQMDQEGDGQDFPQEEVAEHDGLSDVSLTVNNLPCPLCPERPSYSTITSWRTHMETHLRDHAAGNGPPIPEALFSASRQWACEHCNLISALSRSCRGCRHPSPASRPVLPPVVEDLPPSDPLEVKSSQGIPRKVVSSVALPPFWV